jgi:hypothetical protein
MQGPIPPIKDIKIEYCKYCTDFRGRPKPIFPEQIKTAKKMKDGWMCRYCQMESLLKLSSGR